MKPLKLCMVTTFYPPFSFGGDGMFVYRLVQALAERGHSVDVIHSVDAYRLQDSRDPKQEFAEHPEVTLHPLRSRYPRISALTAHQLGSPAAYGARLKALLEDRDYDVIHYHNISLIGGPGVLRLGSALKLYTPHEYWLICPTHVLFKFDREACTERACLRCTLLARRPPQLWRHGGGLARCTRHVDRFLMPSRFALERHRADGIDAPMTVLPSFVPTPAVIANDEPVSDRPFFLCVGRLEKLKGIQDMIELFRGYREADLVIIGDGGYRPELERLARGLEHVCFLGALHPHDLGAYYRQAIAVLVPSLCYEVFPLIPTEALAHGVPVIARRIGALAEVVEESGGGITFDTLDDCAAAMGRLQGDPALRRELGDRGRATAAEKWTPEAYISRYLEIIDELRPA
jgi:glycosyltransferase involved in cell wall biosynthesis